MLVYRNNKAAVTLAALVLTAVFASLSHAAVIWDLNPTPRQHGPVGSASRVYTSGGFQITARGFDNNGGTGIARELFFKNEADSGGAVEFGLGLVNTPHNELNVGLHFMQFDFTASLAAGMFKGELSVGSVQANESFAIFGSNALGTLGTQVGGPFVGIDNQFVNIPNFGQFSYYSIVATAGSVLGIAVRGDFMAQVPEMNALVPICGLIVLLGAAHFLRRRRQTS